MPPAKNNDFDAKLISAALPLFAENGLNVTLDDIATRTGEDLSVIRERFEDPVDLIHKAYRLGQKEMERLFRMPTQGMLDDHMGVLFDGMMLNIRYFGPRTYLGIVYQATKDDILLEVVKHQSKTLNFAIKAFLLDMIRKAIIENVDEVEKVNQELVATFVEHLAQLLEGKDVATIKEAWIEQASAMFVPCVKTTPSLLFDEGPSEGQ